MGEIADMMIEGEMCPCGEYLGGNSGYPQYCSAQCARDYGGVPDKVKPQKASCPTCGKRVKKAGLADHQRDAHGITKEETQ